MDRRTILTSRVWLGPLCLSLSDYINYSWGQLRVRVILNAWGYSRIVDECQKFTKWSLILYGKYRPICYGVGGPYKCRIRDFEYLYNEMYRFLKRLHKFNSEKSTLVGLKRYTRVTLVFRVILSLRPCSLSVFRPLYRLRL